MEKMFFHTFPPAERETGLHPATIQNVLENGSYVYQKKTTGQIFHIRKEDPILIAQINGEDFFSLEQIGEKFGLSPTKFMNQIQTKKFSGKINWLADELFPEREAKRVKDIIEKGKDLPEKLGELEESIQKLLVRVEKLESEKKSDHL